MEALIEYVIDGDAPDSSVSLETYAEQCSAIYDLLFVQWLHAKDFKVGYWRCMDLLVLCVTLGFCRFVRR